MVHVLIQFGVFVPAVTICGYLYAHTFVILLKAKQNPRKIPLVVAFVLLWLLWILCFVPYEIMDLYFIQFHKQTKEYYQCMSGLTSHPSELRRVLFDIQTPHKPNPEVTKFLIVEALFRVLKFSYGFLNSLIVIVVIRQFQDPLVAALSRIRFGLKHCCSKPIEERAAKHCDDYQQSHCAGNANKSVSLKRK